MIGKHVIKGRFIEAAQSKSMELDIRIIKIDK